MSLRIFCFIAFSLFFSGCHIREREKMVRERANDSFKLIKYSNVSYISYSPQNEKNGDSSDTADLAFIKNLLFLLNHTLIQYNYDILVSDEVVLTSSNDTINIKVYDFINEHQDEMQEIFKDNKYIDKFISKYESPISCRFILNNKKLCSICNKGIKIDKRIDNSLFLEYIKGNTRKRIERR